MPVLTLQSQAPVWHPCTLHQACQWGQALAALTSAATVRGALKAELGGRSDRIDLGQDIPGTNADAQAPDASSATWRGSWEAFVGVTKEQLVAWAQSDADQKAWPPS